MLTSFVYSTFTKIKSVNKKLKYNQDNQALLKAMYCPRVSTALRTQINNKKTHVILTFDL